MSDPQQDAQVQDVIAAYDANADAYARYNYTIPMTRAWETMIRYVPPCRHNARTHILDLGCGPGRDVRYFRNKGYFVSGLDRSAGLLGQARDYAGYGLMQGDARRLPVVGGSLDGVWASASLLHLPRADLPGALREIRRVLVANGALFLAMKGGSGTLMDERFGERHFTLYGPDELVARVLDCGLRLHELWLDYYESVTWVNLIAVKPGDE